jgi:putative molybdopterin biosynthesis protein
MTALRQRRLDLGLSQGAIAQAADLSRQALSALEAGRATPSLQSALALARALGTTVEALFGAPDPDGDLADWVGVSPPDGRVLWSRIDGRLVVRPAGPEDEVDAIVQFDSGLPGALQPLTGAADPDRAIWVGGCDPALGLLARAMERAAPHLSVRAVAMTTGEARMALALGQLHVASLHGASDGAGAAGASVLPYVSWREGFVLTGGLKRSELFTPDVRWALRPQGATARDLLEKSAPPGHAPGGLVVSGHWAVADAIRSGQADAGVAVEAAAAAFGLPFEPLQEERVDLVVHPAALEAADALQRALLDDRLWARLGALAGYRRTGT